MWCLCSPLWWSREPDGRYRDIRCRCYERQRAKVWRDWSLTHRDTRWSGGTSYLGEGDVVSVKILLCCQQHHLQLFVSQNLTGGQRIKIDWLTNDLSGTVSYYYVTRKPEKHPFREKRTMWNPLCSCLWHPFNTRVSRRNELICWIRVPLCFHPTQSRLLISRRN